MVATRYSLRAESHAVIAGDTDGHRVTIRFKRTVRVPDNNQVSKLPPSLGNFPLYKVKDYADKLPTEMAQKGGLFLPIYRKYCLIDDGHG